MDGGRGRKTPGSDARDSIIYCAVCISFIFVSVPLSQAPHGQCRGIQSDAVPTVGPCFFQEIITWKARSFIMDNKINCLAFALERKVVSVLLAFFYFTLLQREIDYILRLLTIQASLQRYFGYSLQDMQK